MDQTHGEPRPADRPAGAGGTLDPDGAFRVLFDQHLDPIWRFARRRCGSADDADDVAAETFAVAWRRRADLPPPDEVGLWLFGVARLVLANHRRSRARQEQLHRKLAVSSLAGASSAPGDRDLDRAGQVAAALAALDPDDRDLLIMRAWDGLAVQDMAVLLGCTPNAASIRLHRARQRLADLLDRDTTAGQPHWSHSKDRPAPGHLPDDPLRGRTRRDR